MQVTQLDVLNNSEFIIHCPYVWAFLNFTSINTFGSYCLILIRRVLTGANELYVIVFDFISLLTIFSNSFRNRPASKGNRWEKRSTSSSKHLQQLRLFSGITKALQLRAHQPRRAVVAWGVLRASHPPALNTQQTGNIPNA